MVHVMAGRDSDPLYEQHSGNHRTTMRFGDFVAKVRDAGQTNDFYMVANNDFMRTASVKRLYDDMVVFPDYLDDRRDGSASSWAGTCMGISVSRGFLCRTPFFNPAHSRGAARLRREHRGRDRQ